MGIPVGDIEMLRKDVAAWSIDVNNRARSSGEDAP